MTKVALSGASGNMGKILRAHLPKHGVDLRSAGGRTPQSQSEWYEIPPITSTAVSIAVRPQLANATLPNVWGIRRSVGSQMAIGLTRMS